MVKINQQFQKRHCGNDNSNGFSPRPPVMHRSDSDGSDRTIGHEESPLPKTTKKTKGDRGTCVQADGVTYVWNITSKEYAQLMNDARHHFGRWFGLENENSDINNATHTNRSGTRDSEAVDRIVKAAFPFCDLVQNLNVRKDARAQVKKWFRHWQSETKKAAIKNVSSSRLFVGVARFISNSFSSQTFSQRSSHQQKPFSMKSASSVIFHPGATP